MNKLLSFASLALLGTLSNAQVLYTENFDSYTIGNLGSQGGW